MEVSDTTTVFSEISNLVRIYIQNDLLLFVLTICLPFKQILSFAIALQIGSDAGFRSLRMDVDTTVVTLDPNEKSSIGFEHSASDIAQSLACTRNLVTTEVQKDSAALILQKEHTHFDNICNKANITLGFLRRKPFSCPQDEKKAAYKGMVRPILEYGISVWDP